MPQEESQAAPPALPEITGTPGTSCPMIDDAGTGNTTPEDCPAVDAITAELPSTPITRRTLQAVIIPAPKGNTLTRFILEDGERYAHFEELTQDEKNTVLEFLLRYAAPVVARKPAPRQKEITEPITPENIDPEPLEKLLNTGRKPGRKTKKCEIWLNGKYLETRRSREDAELQVQHYKNQDKHEVQEGYEPVKATYEIKPYRGKPKPSTGNDATPTDPIEPAK